MALGWTHKCVGKEPTLWHAAILQVKSLKSIPAQQRISVRPRPAAASQGAPALVCDAWDRAYQAGHGADGGQRTGRKPVLLWAGEGCLVVSKRNTVHSAAQCILQHSQQPT